MFVLQRPLQAAGSWLVPVAAELLWVWLHASTAAALCPAAAAAAAQAAEEGDLASAQQLWGCMQAAGTAPSRKVMTSYLM